MTMFCLPEGRQPGTDFRIFIVRSRAAEDINKDVDRRLSLDVAVFSNDSEPGSEWSLVNPNALQCRQMDRLNGDISCLQFML